MTRGPGSTGDAASATLEPPEAADVEAVARRLEAAGHACAREGDDIVASDPWGTALRVRAPIATATPGG